MTIERQVASPQATGGAGHLFEYRVAAVMLAHLLCQTRPPGLQVPVARVGLQQRALAYVLDDIVVHAESGPVSTQFQVKQSVTITPSDAEFVDVVHQALKVLSEHADEVARGEIALGLIAERDVKALADLSSLTDWAHQHAEHETFAQPFVPGVVRKELRSRLTHVERTVEKAIAGGAHDLGGAKQATHLFLSALHVWCPSVRDEGADLRAVLDQLEPIGDEYGVTAVDLFAHLEALAKASGPAAGVVDAGWIRRRLHRRGLIKKSSDPVDAMQQIDAEAVVSGPFAALELQAEVDRAEAMLIDGDAKAIEAFGAIAERLRGTPYQPHATMMLRKRANALEADGRDDQATIARVGLVWDDLDRVRPWEAGFALNNGTKPSVQLALSPATEPVLATANAAVWRAKGAAMEDFVAAFDALTLGDLYLDRAAVFLAEEAIAADQPKLIVDRLQLLQGIATDASKSTDDATRRLAIRLRMCLADATGEWIDLVRTVRQDPWRIVAWVRARYARYLALSGDGAGAEEHYLDAIEYASAKERFDEAANWLYALRSVRFMYERFEPDSEHPLAQALRPHAKPSSLPGSPHTAELALQAMLNGDEPHEALRRAERWRWQAVVRAELTDEMRAVRAIGTLQERQGDQEAAIISYVRSGAGETAEAAASRLPEQPAHIDTQLLKAESRGRASAYMAAAKAADLLDDEEAKAWISQALEEITVSETVTSRLQAMPYLGAFKVIVATSQLLSTDESERVLDHIDPRIERPPNVALRTDPEMAQVLLSLASSCPRAVPMLARAIVADQRMAEVILSRPEVLMAHRDELAAALNPLAPSNVYAALAIIESHADPAATLALARAEVDLALKPRRSEPNTFDAYATADRAAIFASVLDQETRNQFARATLERALDETQLMYSRWNDLLGLLIISDFIDCETQAAVLPKVMEIARGERNGAPAVLFVNEPQLPAPALRCAAKLDPDADQCEEIEQAGIAYLRGADEDRQWDVCRALALLPLEASRLNLHQCAVNALPALRALAAVRWAKNPNVLSHDQAAELACDPDQGVRRTLANALRSTDAVMTAEARAVMETLALDVRRSIRVLALSQSR
jgi:hypothetical protein